jgi:ATP-dependent exoDNAse (exonuclease V) beta subunit
MVGGKPKLFLMANTSTFECYAAQRDGERRMAMERLLYVAMTRARNTLILARDGFAGKSESNSPETLMAIDFSKLEQWSPCVLVNAGENVSAVDATAEKRANSTAAIGRVLPEIEPAVRKIEVVDGAAVAYGNWWHRTMEYFPWHAPQRHGAYLAAAAANAPDMGRARLETEALLASNWYGTLHCNALQFFAEWPFFGESDDGGPAAAATVDLLILDPGTNSLTVLDWKTDLIGGGAVTQALERHGKQLRRYTSFLKKRGTWQITAAIYFSSVGELAVYDLPAQ